MTSITPVQIDAMYADLMRKGRADGKGGLSAKTVLYTHRVLNETLEHAVRKNLIARNPVKNIMNTPRPKRFHSTVYSVDELLELLRIVKDTVYELPIALAGICGLRRGECLALRPEDIDFGHHVIHVRRQLIEVRKKIVYTEPKSDESTRTVGVPEEILEMVSRRLSVIRRNKDMLGTEYKDHGLLICKNDGTPFRPRNFTNSFKGILARNHLKGIRFHDLRHTCATLMLRSGIPMKTASEILGHSSISITADLYTHVQESAKLAAAEQVGGLVFGDRGSRK